MISYLRYIIGWQCQLVSVFSAIWGIAVSFTLIQHQIIGSARNILLKTKWMNTFIFLIFLPLTSSLSRRNKLVSMLQPRTVILPGLWLCCALGRYFLFLVVGGRLFQFLGLLHKSVQFGQKRASDFVHVEFHFVFGSVANNGRGTFVFYLDQNAP